MDERLPQGIQHRNPVGRVVFSQPPTSGKNHAFEEAVEREVSRRLTEVARNLEKLGQSLGAPGRQTVLAVAQEIKRAAMPGDASDGDALPDWALEQLSQQQVARDAARGREFREAMIFNQARASADTEPAPGWTKREWADLTEEKRRQIKANLNSIGTQPNLPHTPAAEPAVSRCCGAPITDCGGKPMCQKCRLTLRAPKG